MSDIQTNLDKIIHAVKGEEVRQAIHDSIQECYTDATGGFSNEVKSALETLLANVAYKGNDPTGRTYLTALHNAMYPPVNLVSISAVYTQSGTVYNTDSLDSLKADLVVTAHYDDYSTETVTSYVLSGTLTEGTSVITVSYGGKTTTFSVTVTRDPYVYKLPSEFVSDAANYIDTGVELESGSVYSVLLDYTVTSLLSSVHYIFGNKQADSNVYSALQVTSTQGAHMWGVGIGYSAGSGLVTAGGRYKAVAVAEVDNAKWTITLKDVSAGTTNTYTNTYTVPALANGKAIFIGNGEGGSSNTGFVGTVHDFKIIDRALTSEEITAYLNG